LLFIWVYYHTISKELSIEEELGGGKISGKIQSIVGQGRM